MKRRSFLGWALGPAVLSIAYPEKKGAVIGFYNAACHLGLTFGPILGIMTADTLEEAIEL